MESKDLIAALESLKETLSGIQSAKEQVEQTTKASEALRKTVDGYVSSVNSLYASIQGWEQDLQSRQIDLNTEAQKMLKAVDTSCQQASNAVSKVANGVIENFQKETQSSLNAFVEQNNLLSKRVQEIGTLRANIEKATTEINTLKSSLVQLQRELKDSQDEQDRALADISSKMEVLPGVITQSEGAIIQKSEQHFQEVNAVLGQTTTVINGIDGKIDALTQTASAIQSACNTIKSTIDELKQSVQASETSLQKSINTNRWLIIGGVIIVVILHFI